MPENSRKCGGHRSEQGSQRRAGPTEWPMQSGARHSKGDATTGRSGSCAANRSLARFGLRIPIASGGTRPGCDLRPPRGSDIQTAALLRDGVSSAFAAIADPVQWIARIVRLRRP